MSEEDFNLIESSLRGQLSADQEEALKSRIEADPELKRHYEEMDLMIRAIKSVAAERMVREAKEEHTSGNVVNWPTPRVMALAATVLLIVASGIWLLTRQQEDLFEQYYTPYAELALSQPRGGQMLYEIKVRALEEYRLHEITSALYMLDSALAIDPEDSESLMLSGLCRLEESSYRKALEAFNKIATVQGNDPALQWYTALAHVGLAEHEEARKILKEIETAGPPEFARKAAELSKRLPTQ